MCIGSNSVNQAQDLIFVTKFEDFPNSLLPNIDVVLSIGSPFNLVALSNLGPCCGCYFNRWELRNVFSIKPIFSYRS